MTTIELGSDAVLPFLDYLKQQERFRTITTGENSFEGWLKWELVAFLCARYEKLREANGIRRELIGVETRVPLEDKDRVPEQDRNEKLIDVWFAAGTAETPYHYLELKMIFDNANRQKQANSAGWDLWYLASMKPEAAAASIGTLAFFVGDGPLRESALENTIRDIEASMAPIECTSRESVGLFDHCCALYYETTWAEGRKALRGDWAEIRM